jgi:hypothetical protein
VYTYHCVYDGKVSFNAEEIDEVKAWSMEEIQAHIEGDTLSDNFKHEIKVSLETTGGPGSG